MFSTSLCSGAWSLVLLPPGDTFCESLPLKKALPSQLMVSVLLGEEPSPSFLDKKELLTVVKC